MTDKNSNSVTTVFQRVRSEIEKGNAIGLTLAGGAFAAATGSPAAIALTVAAAVNAGFTFYRHRSVDPS